MIYKSPFPDVQIPDVPLHDYVFEHVDRWADKPALIDGPTDRCPCERGPGSCNDQSGCVP